MQLNGQQIDCESAEQRHYVVPRKENGVHLALLHGGGEGKDGHDLRRTCEPSKLTQQHWEEEAEDKGEHARPKEPFPCLVGAQLEKHRFDILSTHGNATKIR